MMSLFSLWGILGVRASTEAFPPSGSSFAPQSPFPSRPEGASFGAMLILNAIGLFALMALPTILAIHLFRRRFRPRPVTGLFLYGPTVRTVAAGRKRQRILWQASLFAELLVALAIAWYLIDPHVSDRMRAQHVVVVLDSRWRMAAMTPTGSITDRVRTTLSNRLASLNATDRVTLIASGETPTMLSGPAARPDVALLALRTWEPDRPWHSLDSAITLGRSLTDDQTTVLVCSDRPPITPEPDAVYLSLGQPLITSGIAEVRWWNDERGSRIVVRVIAYGGGVSRTLTVSDGTTVIATQAVNLTDDMPVSYTVPIPALAPTELTVALTGPDPLPQDDVVHVQRPDAGIIRVRLSVDPRIAAPFMRGLSVIPGINLLTDDQNPAHIHITDHEVVVPFGTWVFRLQSASTSSVLGPFLQHRGHPLLQGLDFSGVLWSGGLIPDNTTSLDQSPLLLAGQQHLLSEQRRGRDYDFTAYLDPSTSSWAAHPSWPAFLVNLIAMRRATLPGCAQTTVLSTQACRVNLPPGHTAVTLTNDAGKATQLQADREGVVIIPPSDRIGRLRLSLGDKPEIWLTIHVVACDARMADLRLASQTIIGTSTETQNEVERSRSVLEHLLPIVLAALIACLGWLAFTRETGRAP